MPDRRPHIGKGTKFVRKISDLDPEDEVIIFTAVDYDTGRVACKVQSGGTRFDHFSGTMIANERRISIHFVSLLNDKVSFKFVLRRHEKNPDRDHVIIKTKNGLKSMRDALDKLDDGNNGGSPDDPDVEGFSRSTGSGSTVSGNLAGGTITFNDPIQPGSVIVKNPGTTLFAYDFNGILYLFSDNGSVSVPRGTVEYSFVDSSTNPATFKSKVTFYLTGQVGSVEAQKA